MCPPSPPPDCLSVRPSVCLSVCLSSLNVFILWQDELLLLKIYSVHPIQAVSPPPPSPCASPLLSPLPLKIFRAPLPPPPSFQALHYYWKRRFSVISTCRVFSALLAQFTLILRPLTCYPPPSLCSSVTPRAWFVCTCKSFCFVMNFWGKKKR